MEMETWNIEARLVFEITYRGMQQGEGLPEAGPIRMRLADVHFDGGPAGEVFDFFEDFVQFSLEHEGRKVVHGTGICQGLGWIPEGHHALTALDQILRRFPAQGSLSVYFQYCELLMEKKSEDEFVYVVTCLPASLKEGLAARSVSTQNIALPWDQLSGNGQKNRIRNEKRRIANGLEARYGRRAALRRYCGFEDNGEEGYED